MPAERKARCLLVHGTADDTVPVRREDSRAIAQATGIRLLEARRSRAARTA